MKKIIFRLAALAACVLVATNVQAQQENPRGIYKLMRTTIKSGETVKAPIDQYKLCGDSACPMLIIHDPIERRNDITPFELWNINKQPFNYTGDRSAEELGNWIFDSNDEHFTLKWYSAFSAQPWMPAGGWVTEWYERKAPFSEKADWLFNALVKDYPAEKGNLNGFWEVDEGLGKIYQLIDNGRVAMYQAADVQSQDQLMRVAGVIIPFRPSDNDVVKIGDNTYTMNWVDDNTVEMISESTRTSTWHRSALPVAYQSFFKGFKR